MISKPYTFCERNESGILYFSDTDFNYVIKMGDKCVVTLDAECTEWIAGVVSDINEGGFILDTMKGKKVSIACDDICDIYGEMEPEAKEFINKCFKQ